MLGFLNKNNSQLYFATDKTILDNNTRTSILDVLHRLNKSNMDGSIEFREPVSNGKSVCINKDDSSVCITNACMSSDSNAFCDASRGVVSIYLDSDNTRERVYVILTDTVDNIKDYIDKHYINNDKVAQVNKMAKAVYGDVMHDELKKEAESGRLNNADQGKLVTTYEQLRARIQGVIDSEILKDLKLENVLSKLPSSDLVKSANYVSKYLSNSGKIDKNNVTILLPSSRGIKLGEKDQRQVTIANSGMDNTQLDNSIILPIDAIIVDIDKEKLNQIMQSIKKQFSDIKKDIQHMDNDELKQATKQATSQIGDWLNQAWESFKGLFQKGGDLIPVSKYMHVVKQGNLDSVNQRIREYNNSARMAVQRRPSNDHSR